MNDLLQNTSAVVLAGGASSRMGRDKAALDFHGETLLAHTVRKLRDLGILDIIVSGCQTDLDGVRCVPDLYPGRGPLGGLHAGLAAAVNPAALVLAVDTPLLPPSLLGDLVEAHRGGITLLTRGEFIEPLIGVYDCALSADCEELLRADSSSLRKLLHRRGYTPFPFNGNPAVLTNCNTPEDYRFVLSFQEGSP